MKRKLLLSSGLLCLLSLSLVLSANAGNGKKVDKKTPPPPINLVVNSALCFKGMDGVVGFDEDGLVNGTVTLTSLTIVSGGSISYNDPGHVCSDAGVPNDPAGNMTFVVSGSVDIQTGGFLNTENQSAAGNGGAISITCGSFTMEGNGTSGAVISTSNLTATSGGMEGGAITITASGNVIIQDSAVIRANSTKGKAGNIAITGASITVAGTVQTESNGTASGCNGAHGGTLSMIADCTMTETSTGVISSKGNDPGADLVHVQGCTVSIGGLVQSTGVGHAVPFGACANHLSAPNRPDKPSNSTGGVEVWGDRITISSTGEVKADLCCGGGTTGTSWIDIIARKSVNIIGRTSGAYSVHANGNSGSNDNGGIVKVISSEGNVIISGLGLQASTGTNNGSGGADSVYAKTSIDLSGAKLEALGDHIGGNGGTVVVTSYTSNILADLSSLIDVTGGTNDLLPNGVVKLNACGVGPLNIEFPPGIIVPVLVLPVKGNTGCAGVPALQSYVVLPNTNCFQICQNISLPVKMSSFNASRVNSLNVSLSWSTASEVNNRGFEIQRRKNGEADFETVAFVNSKALNGNSSSSLQYSFNDPNNFSDASFYRLMQVDIDNKIAYSEIRLVNGIKEKAKTLVYPNPAGSNEAVHVIFSSDDRRDIQLSDMSGRIIQAWKAYSQPSLNLTQLKTGIYMLRITVVATNENEVQKIVVKN
jgi:hypothetical protein